MRGRRRGIVLVLVSALFSLLLLTATSLLALARGMRAGASIALAARQAHLTSESGMAYAASRLSREETYPLRSPAPFQRADDWTQVPAYAHGAGSGRLRKNASSAPVVFFLGIESAGSKIPVNGVNVTPLWNNAMIHEPNKGLVHVLNNLGALLLPVNPAIGRFDAPAGLNNQGEPIRLSLLGRHLVQNRPLGGYRSIASIRTTLLSLGYGAADCDAVVAHLDVGPYHPVAGPGKAYGVSYPLAGYTEQYVPIELATAPPVLLKVVWLYLCASRNHPFPREADLPSTTRRAPGRAPRRTSPFSPSRRTGPPMRASPRGGPGGSTMARVRRRRKGRDLSSESFPTSWGFPLPGRPASGRIRTSRTREGS